MSWQLIYTSAPRGLLSGQSGFCTVARSADLREALVGRLEQISSYHYLRVSEAATANRNPTISAFRLLDLRGTKYCVLTRIQPCGLDFTARTNHLAHHLVFQPEELAQLPSPAAILLHWPGWVTSWQGEPRLLESVAEEDFAPAAKSFLPAQTWMRVTGDAGRAAGLLEAECLRGCYLVCPSGGETRVLEMFCETLQLLNLNGQYALRPWRHPFTTFLQAEDDAADFQWRACQQGTPAYQQAVQRSAPLLTLANVRVPENSLVKTAREGLKPPAPPAAAADLRRLPASRRAPAQPIITRPVRRPDASRRSSSISLIQVYAAVRLRISMIGQWFSNHPAGLRAFGIFAAMLLGLYALNHYKKHQPPPSPPVVTTPAEPPRVETPGGPAPGPTPPARTVPTPAPPPDTTQLAWLSGQGQTFVFATSNLARFDLPMDSIAPFANLLHRFDKYETRPSDMRLSVNTNQWGFQAETPMTVNGRTNQALSAQTASGIECSFDYSEWLLGKTNPAVVQTLFAAPPRAFSVQFGFSSPTNGDPFRLLVVNLTNPPPPARMSAGWLNPNGASVPASLKAPLGPLLVGQFTFLQMEPQPFRLWRFIQRGQQTIYLDDKSPGGGSPPGGAPLDSTEVKKGLADATNRLEVQISIRRRKLDELAQMVNYPFGKDLGLPDPLSSLTKWTNAPTQSLFLSYLGELRKAGRLNNAWVGDTNWPPQLAVDANLADNFQKLSDLWMLNVPAANTNADFANCFKGTWQTLKELETTRQEQQSDQDDLDKDRERLKSDENVYIGLFIIAPGQPQRALQMIRFERP